MKFTCEKYVFQAAVSVAARAAAGKSPIAALEGILIEAGEKIKLTGYDLKKGVYTHVPADVSETGSVVLNAKLVSDIIRLLPDGVVSVHAGQDNLTTIKCGKAEYSLMGSNAEDYPEVMPVEGGLNIALNQGKLKSVISQTLFAVSSNESRPVYTGSLFDIKGESLMVVSVDGYRLAMRKENIDEARVDVSFIVPGSALSDVEKLCTEDAEDAVITVGAKQIGFSFGDTVLVSRRLEGDFISFDTAVPKEFNTIVTADKSLLQRAAERVSLIIDDRVKSPLRVKFGEETIDIFCATTLGKAEDTLPVNGITGPELEIGFNNRYLLDALKTISREEVKICLGTGTTPCVIKSAEDGDDSFLHMILPVRLGD